MGATESAPVQPDAKSPEEDASAPASASSPGDRNAEVSVLQEEGGGDGGGGGGGCALDTKPLHKNGQISSLTSLNGLSEDNTLAEVGQPDAVPQKEEALETVAPTQEEVAPQVNGEKVEKESADANDITAVEEKAGEEKPEDATEVGFKKIFRFVGFKFTLKKDKNEEKDPVKLLTVKDKEDGEEVSGAEQPTKEEEAVTSEEKEGDTEASTAEGEVTEDKTETTDAPAESAAAGDSDEAVKEEAAEKEGEASPSSQETTGTLSPFRKLFTGGLFSNLRKKASIKKTKEEEDKEAVAEEEGAKPEEGDAEKEKVDSEKEDKEEAAAAPEEDKSEPKEEVAAAPEEAKSEATQEPEETPAPTEEAKPEEEKAEGGAEEEKAPAEVTTEAELLSSQEKAKPQGSPLKKLFTGAGLKKLSTKKQKAKKEAESKAAESGESAAEQLQSSTESAEAPKAESGPSSPEESGEHVLAVEASQTESSQETDGEVASDGEKKKEGIIAWSSFKRLVTPKKLVKRSSESDDEANGEKPAKSATLSSSESAALADKSVEEETKEEKTTEEEPKTETTEKLVSSTEEPKKKMDTSVSWEALMCMGGAKKRTRRTSDSDDEETKMEEDATAVEAVAEGEEEVKAEAAEVTAAPPTTEVEEEVVSSPEPVSPPERESTWDTLKRMVMPKSKPKIEEKPEESANQTGSDSEAPKEESSFSLRKFFPGRRKKKVEKQASSEGGDEDSDTPAVVPLSEYDDQVEAKEETPAEPAEVQSQVSAEERSPSWIPASVEEADNNHDQLSDIPEEGENAATPKSVDTDIADDEAMQSPKGLGRMGRRLSTAEMKPVAEAPAGQTTLVPQGPTSDNAEEVVACVDAQISEIAAQTSATVFDVPVETATEKVEDEPVLGQAEEKSTTILQPHTPDEAMAICTGLGTKEIAKVAVEKPASPLVETMAVVRDALATEVFIEEKPATPEEATATQDTVFMAQVHQVETTDLEPAVDSSPDDDVDIQVAAESCEPQMERVGVVTTLLENTTTLQTTTVSENSPKAAVIDPITPTSESTICTESVEVTELTIETREEKIEADQLVSAAEENAAVTEVVQVVTEEMSSIICSTVKNTITEETEPAVPVILPNEQSTVIAESAIQIAATSVESDQVATSEEAVVTSASVSEQVLNDVMEVEALEEEPAVEVEVESESTAVTCTIEAQSKVIAENIIQDAMGKVTESEPEAKKPAAVPSPAQATAGTEEEIATESIVITDTPVPVGCDQPKSPQQLHVAMEVIDTIPIEVTESLDAPEEEEKEEEEKEEKEEEKEEEEKPEEGLKQAVEVNVCEEESVVVEEVAEEKEPSKEEEEEEEEKKEELHMPVQVVLQTGQLVEEVTLEEEAVVFDSNGPVNGDESQKPESPTTTSVSKLSTLSEEAQAAAAVASEEVTEAAPSGKCAEVMAQVMEVIEEAVKEIEPVSTEITAAS